MYRFLQKKIAEAVAAIDLRGGIAIDLQMIDEWDDNGEVMTTYEIHPYVNGKQVGYMDFIIHKFIDNIEENYIEVVSIQIDEEYRGLGISTEVYKAFSDLYEQQYDGYPLERLFQNPIAEYSFRKAVSNGYVSSTLLDNSRIKREYKTEDKQRQWNELNKKLPEHVRGAKARVGKYMSNVRLAASAVELRNVVISDEGVLKDKSADDYKDVSRLILATVNGQKVGSLEFSVMENFPGEMLAPEFEMDTFDNIIWIDSIDVKPEYQNLGIATALYQKFGEIYSADYNGWPVARYFMNPVAEYAFRKAVSLGYVSENALSEDHIIREKDFYNAQSEKVKDLRNKLPENVQGPAVWAKMKDFRKVLAQKTVDLRKIAKTIIADMRKVADSSTFIDLRGLEYEVISNDSTYFSHEDINAYVDGVEIGYLSLTVYKDDQLLEVDMLEVDHNYQNLGIATGLYKEFGKLYESKYNGWAVTRYFVNPVAEYAFRKAVSLGYVSENALNEDKIRREKDEEHNVLWRDLRQKLPENVKGPETWASKRDFRKVLAEAAPVDLRSITTSTEITDVEEDDDEEYYYFGQTYKISAMVGAEEVGYLNFVETRTRADNQDDHFLYLAKIEVDNKYRELGIGTLLYQEFGNIYSQKFNGWAVERHFENPVAEYAFKKAIELGFVSVDAFTESRTTRNYTPAQQKLWDEKLAPKLTKASRKDLRRIMAMKKESAVLDLRRSTRPLGENVTDLRTKPEADNVTNLMNKQLNPNIIDLRDINKLQFDTLDNYYKETGFKPEASLKDIRKSIGKVYLNDLRKLADKK